MYKRFLKLLHGSIKKTYVLYKKEKYGIFIICFFNYYIFIYSVYYRYAL